MPDADDPAIVRFSGEHDIATRAQMHATFQGVRDNPRVIVDLTKVHFIDSTAMSELFRASERATSLGGMLVVVARNQRLVRLLSIAGLTARLTITDTIAIALDLVRNLPGPGEQR